MKHIGRVGHQMNKTLRKLNNTVKALQKNMTSEIAKKVFETHAVVV